MIQTEIKGTESKNVIFINFPEFVIIYPDSLLTYGNLHPSSTKSLFFVAQMTTWSILQIHDSTKTHLTLSTRSQNLFSASSEST